MDKLPHLLDLIPVVTEWAIKHPNPKAHIASTALLLRIISTLEDPK